MHRSDFLKFLATFSLGGIVKNNPPRKITINAIPGIQYDKVRLKVQPGEKVKLVLENTSDLDHNLLITKPGTRLKVVEEALALAEKGPDMDYNPESTDVLWSIPVLSSGEIQSVTFTAPAGEGVYPYVCTLPGHGYTMYGALYVTNGKLPPRTNDQHIPESRRELTGEENSRPHPYALIPPYFYRTFMPDAYPPAIAVRLTNVISYCWDANTCQLLYAWKGGFIDNSVDWRGHKNAEARISGEIFYKLKNKNPFRLNTPDHIPEVAYKGFKLVDEYPEFHYTVDGKHIYEKIVPGGNESELAQTFRMPDFHDTLWLKLDAEGEYNISSNKGKWHNSMLEVDLEKTRQFSINIQHK